MGKFITCLTQVHIYVLQIPNTSLFLQLNHIYMKYRKLTKAELETLESEFIRFLASNTITADDWVKIKKESPEKAENLIDMFSDIVIGQTLERITYLDLKRPKDIRSFYCEKDKIYMKGIFIDGATDKVFDINEIPEKMFSNIQNTEVDLKVFKAERAYKETREMELFRLLEQGALISKDGHLYNLLSQLC